MNFPRISSEVERAAMDRALHSAYHQVQQQRLKATLAFAVVSALNLVFYIARHEPNDARSGLLARAYASA